MDTSEQYVEMCRGAEELHDLRGDGLWQEGDFYNCTTSRGPFQGVWTSGEDEPPQMFKPFLLLRQDQIQAIGNYDRLISKVIGFSRFWTDDIVYKRFGICKDWTGFFSMEQLWLAFHMSMVYRRIWDGKQWKNL